MADPIFDPLKCNVDPQPTILDDSLLGDCAVPDVPDIIHEPPPPSLLQALASPGALIAWSGAGIVARSGTTIGTFTPGRAVLDLYAVRLSAPVAGGAAGAPALEYAGKGTVMNFSTTPVGSSKIIVVLPILWNGFMVVWDPC